MQNFWLRICFMHHIELNKVKSGSKNVYDTRSQWFSNIWHAFQ